MSVGMECALRTVVWSDIRNLLLLTALRPTVCQPARMQVAFTGAFGYALLNFRPASITYRLYIFNITAPRGARIHIGPAGAPPLGITALYHAVAGCPLSSTSIGSYVCMAMMHTLCFR